MALYHNGILISGANTLPQLTLAEYNALPADQRPTYWERLDADYDDVLADKTDIATVESGTTASRAYSVGELVYVSGTLYSVKTAIASGATFTVGTNIEVTDVSDAIGLKQDKVTDSGWVALGSYLKYRKIGDIVSVKAISNGYSVSTSSWTTLGTLPSGYRPYEVSVFYAITNEPNNDYYLSVRVDSNGNVRVNGTSASLFQITFII